MTWLKQRFESLSLNTDFTSYNTLDCAVKAVEKCILQMNQRCIFCHKDLQVQFLKLQTCGGDLCDMKLHMSGLLNVFRIVKKDPDTAIFLLETAYMAYSSLKNKSERMSKEACRPFPSYIFDSNNIQDR